MGSRCGRCDSLGGRNEGLLMGCLTRLIISIISLPLPHGTRCVSPLLKSRDRGVYYHTNGLYGLLKIHLIHFEGGMEDRVKTNG